MFDCIDASQGHNSHAFTLPLTEDQFPRYHASTRAIPASCCGARMEWRPHSFYVPSGNPLTGQRCVSHTKGIRIIPGKLNQEIVVCPEERVTEVVLGGETLTLITLKSHQKNKKPYIPGKTLLPDREFNPDDPQYKLIYTTTDIVPLYFQYFSAWMAPASHRLWPGWDSGLRLSQAKKDAYEEWCRTTDQWMATRPGFSFFIITTDMLNEFEIWRYKFNVSVVYEERKIVNHNYSDLDRLNIFITQGA